MKYVSAFIFSALFCFSLNMKASSYLQMTNLPTIYINTYDSLPINSKEEYKVGELYYCYNGSVIRYDSLKIRGRGNSTWLMPKKPYRIKFSKKVDFVQKGRKYKSWTLLANCSDKLMIRNALMSELGKFVGIEFNPIAVFVDLYLNWEYQGTYQISDHVEVQDKRVELDDGGFFLEALDKQAIARDEGDKPWFSTKNDVGVLIKYPEKEIITIDKVNYIQSFIDNFENVLFSSSFDSEDGYMKFVDKNSLIAWYIAIEVSANVDGFYSTYFYKKSNEEKLYFGPLWDFDIAWNNCYRKGDITYSLMIEDGFWQYASGIWINRMHMDRNFISAVNKRWKELINLGIKDFLINKVDSLVDVIWESQVLNYKRWMIDYRYYDELCLHTTYSEYCNDIKIFISDRIDFLTEKFDFLDSKSNIDNNDNCSSVSNVYYDLKGNRSRRKTKGFFIEKGKDGYHKKIIR